MVKKNLQRALSIILVILIVSFCVGKLGHILRPTNTDVCINAIDAFHSMPENSLEVICYGSSHVWHGIDVMELYKEYGIGAYNYGCNWQKFNTSLLFLEDSLRTQKPKVVLMETFKVDDFKIDQNIDGEIYYTTAIDEFDGKKRYLKRAFGNDKERFLSYYMPLCAFHDNWTAITESSFYTDMTYCDDFIQTMGYFDSDSVREATLLDPATFPEYDLRPEAIEFLDQMVKVCNENGAELVFFVVPWAGEYAYSDAMSQYAAANGCKFIDLYDYVDEMGIDGSTDYIDPAHLNNSGAAKVADFMGKYLADNYDLTDFRTIDNNLWEQALKR